MEYKYTLDKKVLDELTSLSNRSNNQTLFLFQLVDGDINKLKQLELNIRVAMLSYCPNDKEFIDKFSKPMECKHKVYGHIGKIMRYLNGTKNFHNQVGVYWYGGNEGNKHSDKIKENGLPSYWCNARDIIAIY
jgi:hypothetical protein